MNYRHHNLVYILLYFRLHVSTAFNSHHQAFHMQHVKDKIVSNWHLSFT
jgi:hypothetical protein